MLVVNHIAMQKTAWLLKHSYCSDLLLAASCTVFAVPFVLLS